MSISLNALHTERLSLISLYEECAHFEGIALPETVLINQPLASGGRDKQAQRLSSSIGRQLHALHLGTEARIDLHGLELDTVSNVPHSSAVFGGPNSWHFPHFLKVLTAFTKCFKSYGLLPSPLTH